MPRTVEFTYDVNDHVLIIAYALNLHGRIVGCHYTKAGVEYKVEFALDGKIDYMYCEDEHLIMREEVMEKNLLRECLDYIESFKESYCTSDGKFKNEWKRSDPEQYALYKKLKQYFGEVV